VSFHSAARRWRQWSVLTSWQQCGRQWERLNTCFLVVCWRKPCGLLVSLATGRPRSWCPLSSITTVKTQPTVQLGQSFLVLLSFVSQIWQLTTFMLGNENTRDIKSPPECNSALESSRFWTYLSFWSYLAAIKISWRCLKLFKSHRIDKQTNKHRHTSRHRHCWKPCHLRCAVSAWFATTDSVYGIAHWLCLSLARSISRQSTEDAAHCTPESCSRDCCKRESPLLHSWSFWVSDDVVISQSVTFNQSVSYFYIASKSVNASEVASKWFWCQSYWGQTTLFAIVLS